MEDFNTQDITGQDGPVISDFDRKKHEAYTNPNGKHLSGLDLSRSSIEDAVEQRLRDAQKNKEFQDSEGRIGGSRKEQVAVKIISVQQLPTLELDPINAHKLVTKDRVWPEYDLEAEKANGVSAAAAYMKVKLREACSAKPFDSKDAREVFTQGLTKLQEALNVAKTLDEVLYIAKRFVDTDYAYLGDISNLKTYHTSGFRTVNGVKEHFEGYFPSERDLRKKLETIYGIRFINQCKLISDAAFGNYKDAKNKSAISEAMQAAYLQKFNEQIERKIQNYSEELADIHHANDEKLWRYYKDRYSTLAKKKDFEAEKDKVRALLMGGLERKIQSVEKQAKETNENIPLEFKAREEDWSWAFAKTESKKTVSGEAPKEKINTKPALDFISRKGGLEITQVSVEAIRKLFGFKEVEFGNSVSDRRSKEDVHHFLGAIADLSEMLNVDMMAVNKLGGLSIAFGSRGVGGSKAVYFPDRKIINLNKSNGDGSVAHEWAHYLDNIISEKDIHRASYTFASHLKVDNPKLKEVFSSLMKVLVYGDPYDNNPTIDVTFHRIDGVKYKTFGETLEECIAGIQRQHSTYRTTAEVNNKSVRQYFGFLAAKFDKPYIVVPMKLATSMFYYVSSKMGTKYWIEPHELFARAFESFILRKLQAAGRENNYLVSIHKNGDPNRPYPFGKEAELMDEYFEWVIDEFKKQFGIGDFVPFTEKRVDEKLELEQEKKPVEETTTEETTTEQPATVLEETTLVTESEIAVLAASELKVGSEQVLASGRETSSQELSTTVYQEGSHYQEYEEPSTAHLLETPYSLFVIKKIGEQYNSTSNPNKYYAPHQVESRYRQIVAARGNTIDGNSMLEEAYTQFFPENEKSIALENLHKAFKDASEAETTDANATTYDKRVATNLKHMGTLREDWKAVAISGFSETEKNGQMIKMPVFAFPKGYNEAPTLYKSSVGELICELCSKAKLATLFYLQNDTKQWTLKVGSECVKRFGSGKSGVEMAREQKLALAIEFDKEVLELTRFLTRKFSYLEDRGYGKKSRVWKSSYSDLKKTTIYWSKEHDKLKVFNYEGQLQWIKTGSSTQETTDKELFTWYTRNEQKQKEVMEEITSLLTYFGVIYPETEKAAEESQMEKAVRHGYSSTLETFLTYSGWSNPFTDPNYIHAPDEQNKQIFLNESNRKRDQLVELHKTYIKIGLQQGKKIDNLVLQDYPEFRKYMSREPLKEDYEKSWQEYVMSSYGSASSMKQAHERLIKEAVAAGKTVPYAVLAEYSYLFTPIAPHAVTANNSAIEHKYLLTRRPFSIGTFPTEHFIRYEEPAISDEKYGVLYYAEPLSKQRMNDFELYPYLSIAQFAIGSKWSYEPLPGKSIPMLIEKVVPVAISASVTYNGRTKTEYYSSKSWMKLIENGKILPFPITPEELYSWQMTFETWQAALSELREKHRKVRYSYELTPIEEKINFLMEGHKNNKKAAYTTQFGSTYYQHAKVHDKQIHRNIISKAIADGKPVPEEVLAEYPQLRLENPTRKDENTERLANLHVGDVVSVNLEELGSLTTQPKFDIKNLISELIRDKVIDNNYDLPNVRFMVKGLREDGKFGTIAHLRIYKSRKSSDLQYYVSRSETISFIKHDTSKPEITLDMRIAESWEKEGWQVPLELVKQGGFPGQTSQDYAEFHAKGEVFWADPLNVHRWNVEQAIKAGKPVPEEVLADYGELLPSADQVDTMPEVDKGTDTVQLVEETTDEETTDYDSNFVDDSDNPISNWYFTGEIGEIGEGKPGFIQYIDPKKDYLYRDSLVGSLTVGVYRDLTVYFSKKLATLIVPMQVQRSVALHRVNPDKIVWLRNEAVKKIAKQFDLIFINEGLGYQKKQAPVDTKSEPVVFAQETVPTPDSNLAIWQYLPKDWWQQKLKIKYKADWFDNVTERHLSEVNSTTYSAYNTLKQYAKKEFTAPLTGTEEKLLSIFENGVLTRRIAKTILFSPELDSLDKNDKKALCSLLYNGHLLFFELTNDREVIIKNYHKIALYEAILNGEALEVSVEVLAHYPDLQKAFTKAKNQAQKAAHPASVLDWQRFTDSDEVYDLLQKHATENNGPASVKYKDGRILEFRSLQTALFSKKLSGTTYEEKMVEIGWWDVIEVKCATKLPGKFTHTEFVEALSKEKMGFLTSTEEAIEKFFRANFKLVSTSGGIALLAHKATGDILTIKGTSYKSAFDLLYQVSVGIEAKKVEPFTLSLYHFATMRFTAETRAEMTMLGALHIPVESYRSAHLAIVQKAIEEGKEVPERVVKDYPELQQVQSLPQHAWQMKFDRWFSLGWRVDDDTYKTFALIRSTLDNSELLKVYYLHGNTSRWWNGHSKERQMELLKEIHAKLISSSIEAGKEVPANVLKEYKSNFKPQSSASVAAWSLTFEQWNQQGWFIDETTPSYFTIASKLSPVSLHRVGLSDGITPREWWDKHTEAQKMKILKDIHFGLVKDALNAGHPLPAEVKGEYADKLEKPKTSAWPEGKYAYELNKAELRAACATTEKWDRDRMISGHEHTIKNAIREGKQIPEKVYVDYPQLRPTPNFDKLYQIYIGDEGHLLTLEEYLRCYVGLGNRFDIDWVIQNLSITPNGPFVPEAVFTERPVIKNAMLAHKMLVELAVKEGRAVTERVLQFYPYLNRPVAAAMVENRQYAHKFTLNEFIKLIHIKEIDGKPHVYLNGNLIGRGSIRKVHEGSIEKALQAGLPVKVEVLREYPELEQKAAQTIYFNSFSTPTYPAERNRVVIEVKDLSGNLINFTHSIFDGTHAHMQVVANKLFKHVFKSFKNVSAKQSKVTATDESGKVAFALSSNSWISEGIITVEPIVETAIAPNIEEDEIVLATARAKAAKARIRIILLKSKLLKNQLN